MNLWCQISCCFHCLIADVDVRTLHCIALYELISGFQISNSTAAWANSRGWFLLWRPIISNNKNKDGTHILHLHSPINALCWGAIVHLFFATFVELPDIVLPTLFCQLSWSWAVVWVSYFQQYDRSWWGEWSTKCISIRMIVNKWCWNYWPSDLSLV